MADYAALNDTAFRRRYERPDTPGSGVFVAEGRLVVARLLRSGWAVRSVLLAPAHLTALAEDLAGLVAPVYVAEQEVLNAIVGFDAHRGVLAAGGRRLPPEAGELLSNAHTVAVVEAVNDHENMGALFRNAAAFGVQAVLLSPQCCDPLYRRAVRVSMGLVLHVPFTTLAPWPQALGMAGAHGFTLVALTPAADAEPLDRLRPAPGERVAVLLGAEGGGLSPAALAAAARRVRIPMAAGVDSLNVATAAAVAFHHLSAGRSGGDDPGGRRRHR